MSRFPLAAVFADSAVVLLGITKPLVVILAALQLQCCQGLFWKSHMFSQCFVLLDMVLTHLYLWHLPHKAWRSEDGLLWCGSRGHRASGTTICVAEQQWNQTLSFILAKHLPLQSDNHNQTTLHCIFLIISSFYFSLLKPTQIPFSHVDSYCTNTGRWPKGLEYLLHLS